MMNNNNPFHDISYSYDKLIKNVILSAIEGAYNKLTLTLRWINT